VRIRVDPNDVARYVAEALSKGVVNIEFVRVERSGESIYAVFRVDLCKMSPAFVCEGGEMYVVVNV